MHTRLFMESCVWVMHSIHDSGAQCTVDLRRRGQPDVFKSMFKWLLWLLVCRSRQLYYCLEVRVAPLPLLLAPAEGRWPSATLHGWWPSATWRQSVRPYVRPQKNYPLFHTFGDFDFDTFGYFWRGDTVVVRAASLDYAHFRFWQTLEYNTGSQGPFGTYTRIESNINGGLGIWGGISYNDYTIIIPE